MKKTLLLLFIAFFLVSVPLFSPETDKFPPEVAFSKMSGPAPQSEKRPKYDYMSTILSRSTRPLGLKENVALNKFLNQPSIKWAVRAGERHILH